MADDIAQNAEPLCEHLQPVLEYCLSQGAKLTFVGQAWSSNCRRWAYVDRYLDCESLQKKFALPAVVAIHDHRGTHDGAERGLVCNEHKDAVMGVHPSMGSGAIKTIA